MNALRRLLYLGYYFRQLDWAQPNHFMRRDKRRFYQAYRPFFRHRNTDRRKPRLV